MIRTGIVGSEVMCRNYLDSIKGVGELRLVGFFDPDTRLLPHTEAMFEKKLYEEPDSLLRDVDAVIALSPMSSPQHIETFVRSSKHVLFEPTHFFSRTEANNLMNMIEEADVKVQPSFDKRYNMVFGAVKGFIKAPRLIVSNHFTTFKTNAQVSVLMDVLLHDIDLVLSLVNSEIKSVSATAVSIDRSQPDVINARIEFNNKCVAQFNAGRIATESKNEIHFYQNSAYVFADLQNHQAFLAKKAGNLSDVGLFTTRKGDLLCDPIPIGNQNDTYNSVKAFASAILKNTNPEVNVESMMKTFTVIQNISEKLKIVSH